MVYTPSLHNYRGSGKLKGSITHNTGGLSNLIERGGIKKNMDVLVGSVLLHSLDNLPHLDKDMVNSSLTASSDKQRCEPHDDSYTRFKYNNELYVMLSCSNMQVQDTDVNIYLSIYLFIIKSKFRNRGSTSDRNCMSGQRISH